MRGSYIWHNMYTHIQFISSFAICLYFTYFFQTCCSWKFSRIETFALINLKFDFIPPPQKKENLNLLTIYHICVHLIIHQWLYIFSFTWAVMLNFVHVSEKCVFSSECGVYSRYKHTYESTPLHFGSFQKIEQPNIHMQTHIWKCYITSHILCEYP